MPRLLIMALLALAVVPAQAVADTFAIDVFIGAPAQDGFVQINVGPRDSLYIPVGAFPADGKLSFDAEFEHNKFEGQDIPGALSKAQLQQKLREVFDHVNRAYAPAGVSFRIRSITFIDPAKTGMGPRVNEDGGSMNMGVTGDTSDLVARFRTLTNSDGSAFKMLMVPIDDAESREEGHADKPGTHSVVDLSRVFLELDRGFIVAHELGHNFGLSHVEGSPFQHVMAETTPPRGPLVTGPDRTRACENAIGEDACKKIDKIVDNYRSQRWVEERGGRSGGEGGNAEQQEGGSEQEE